MVLGANKMSFWKNFINTFDPNYIGKTMPYSSKATAEDSRKIAEDILGKEFCEEMLDTQRSASSDLAEKIFGKEFMDECINDIHKRGW